MSSLEFISKNGDREVSVKIEAIGIGEVLEAFEDFLKASGFCFNGTLEIVGGDDE